MGEQDVTASAFPVYAGIRHCISMLQRTVLIQSVFSINMRLGKRKQIIWS